MAKCTCGQTFDFASERHQKIKRWLHHKFCPNPPEGFTKIRASKKAMMPREQQHAEFERLKKVYKNH